LKNEEEEAPMSEEERFALDNYYAEHNSFWGDIVINLQEHSALYFKRRICKWEF